MIIYCFCDYYDFELGCKIIAYVALFNAIYLLFQSTIFNTTGTVLQWNIPGLPVKIAEGYLDGVVSQSVNIRFSGMFSEPAQFSHYAITGLLVFVFKENLFSRSFRII